LGGGANKSDGGDQGEKGHHSAGGIDERAQLIAAEGAVFPGCSVEAGGDGVVGRRDVD